MVPEILPISIPCFFATATYKASKIAAVELMVIEVETLSKGISSKRISISFNESMATPTLPTSPSAKGSSESYPIWVGKSNATDNPVVPLSNK